MGTSRVLFFKKILDSELRFKDSKKKESYYNEYNYNEGT